MTSAAAPSAAAAAPESAGWLTSAPEANAGREDGPRRAVSQTQTTPAAACVAAANGDILLRHVSDTGNTLIQDQMSN